MKFVICIAVSGICIYKLLKMCRWTGKLEFYVKGGQHDRNIQHSKGHSHLGN